MPPEKACVLQSRAESDGKRNKLAKLRGVAGIREEKISEAERELNESGQKEKQAAEVYETIVRRMTEDLARFQVQRTLTFLALNACCTRKNILNSFLQAFLVLFSCSRALTYFQLVCP